MSAPSTVRSPRPLLRTVAPTLAGAVLAACMPEAPEDTTHLRVVAVRAEPATGTPGAAVELQLLHSAELFDDASSSDKVATEVAWLGGCHNPPGGQYFSCYPGLRKLVQRCAPRVYDTEPSALERSAGLLGLGTSFAFTVPDDILGSDRPVGVSYVFFAVCRGTLEVRSELKDTVPLGCVDPRGRAVGRTGFEVGFATVSSVLGMANTNPVLDGLRLNGAGLGAESCQNDDDCPAIGEPSVARSCQAAGEDELRCVPVLERSTEPDAWDYRVTLEVGSTSAEPNPLIDPAAATPPREALQAELLTPWSDSTKDFTWQTDAWRPAPELWLRVPSDYAEASARLWLVLRDNRGGVTWSAYEVRIGTQP
ncbi:MAG: hypothetical protein JW940_00435 [Polyangiaceae bacterium]|nr:hypothetical protein [Polyangiaceae bacterium]